MKNNCFSKLYNKNDGILCNFFGFNLFGSSKLTLLNMISYDIKKGHKIWIATVNPEFVMVAIKDSSFLKLLQTRTTYNVIDGIGLIWAIETQLRITNYELRIGNKINILCKIYFAFIVGVLILQGKLRENLIMGADLMDDLCAMAEKNGQTVYFLGGWNNRGEKTADFFLKRYPKLKVAGYYAGNRKGEDEIALKAIGNRRIDYLFVAYAMKDQEEWIERNIDKLNVGVVMGVGRSFDYYSGDLTRAPKWIRKIGFEWLFSLIIEPKRWKRQLALPKFIWMVLRNPLRI